MDARLPSEARDELAAKGLDIDQGMALKLIGMPTTILINKDGLEVGRLAGSAKWDSDDAKKLIEAAIN